MLERFHVNWSVIICAILFGLKSLLLVGMRNLSKSTSALPWCHAQMQLLRYSGHVSEYPLVWISNRSGVAEVHGVPSSASDVQYSRTWMSILSSIWSHLIWTISGVMLWLVLLLDMVEVVIAFSQVPQAPLDRGVLYSGNFLEFKYSRCDRLDEVGWQRPSAHCASGRARTWRAMEALVKENWERPRTVSWTKHLFVVAFILRTAAKCSRYRLWICWAVRILFSTRLCMNLLRGRSLPNRIAV